MVENGMLTGFVDRDHCTIDRGRVFTLILVDPWTMRRCGCDSKNNPAMPRTEMEGTGAEDRTNDRNKPWPGVKEWFNTYTTDTVGMVAKVGGDCGERCNDEDVVSF